MLPYYLERYPQISRAVTPLARLIRSTPTLSHRVNFPTGQFELEARFGTYDSATGRFVAGVSKSFFDQTIRLFEQFQEWHDITPWQECVDYYYALDAQTSARTSVFVNNQKIQPQHIRKHSHGELTFQTESRYRRLYDLRTELNFEEHLPEKKLPDRVNPTHVRIKTRRSYLYGRNRASEALWSYDLSSVWSGATKSEAEHNQYHNLNTVYDIELEMLNPEKYMQVTKQDEMFAASSLLLKMVRVFDVDEQQFSVVPVL